MTADPAADTPADRFRRVAATFSEVARAVPADRWDDPSPCEGWTARDVVSHMLDWMPPFLESIAGPVAPGPDVTTDPAAAWDSLAAQIQAVLDDPDRAGREITHEHLGTTTVAGAIATAVTGDVFIHAWDVARATGGEEALPPDIVHDMLVGAEPIADSLAASGHFGKRILVGADADEQTRLLALMGRRV